MLIQAICLALPGRAKVGFPRSSGRVSPPDWGWMCAWSGNSPRKPPGRPVIFVSNHSSWIDVPVVGGVLPGFRRQGRYRGLAGGAYHRPARPHRLRQPAARLHCAGAGRDASGSGARRQPDFVPGRHQFRRLARAAVPLVVLRAGRGKPATTPTRPLIQPVSVVYDRLNGLPAGRSSRPVFAWYGDMDIASHFWRMTQHLDMRVTVLLHAPLDPAMFPDRKSLSRSVWQTVADGASMLRQNRPARPLSIEPVHPAIWRIRSRPMREFTPDPGAPETECY